MLMSGDRQYLLMQEYQKDTESKGWQAFLECTDLPNPALEAEINTYCLLWEKETFASLEDAAAKVRVPPMSPTARPRTRYTVQPTDAACAVPVNLAVGERVPAVYEFAALNLHV